MHKLILAGGTVSILVVVLLVFAWRQGDSQSVHYSSEQTKVVATTSSSVETATSSEAGSADDKIKVHVFYYTTGDISNDASFSGFDRYVEKGPAVADAALRSLFLGPTQAEVVAGANPTTAPKLGAGYLGVSLVDGVAYVNLTQEAFNTIFGRAPGENAPLSGSIKKTLLQFDSVHDVRYLIDGKPAQFDA